MSPPRGLDMEALGEAIGPELRGAAELRPWLPRLAPGALAATLDTPARPFLGAALLDAPDGARALELWRRLRELAPRLGALPVIVGSPDDVALTELRQPLESSDAAVARLERDLALARATEGGRVLARLASERLPAPGPLDPAAFELTASELAPREDPFLFVDESAGHTAVALVPADESALLPVHLGFGAFGACPRPTEVAAVLLDWSARFGPLDVVFAGAATLELQVANPPRTTEGLRAVALEQFALCPGVVTHGSGSLAKLVRQLAGSRRWALWWD